MLNNTEHIDVLIALVLSGEANPEQVREVELWRQASEENRVYFEEMKQVFDSVQATDTNDYQVDKAWEKVKLSLNDSQVVKLKSKHFYESTWFRIAAVILVVVGVSWMLFLNQSVNMLAVISSDKVMHDTMPDGSIITLNKHSVIQYADNFGKKNRRVVLKGEAYFNVVHDEKIPFVVETNGVFIKDIGTAFNVSTNNDSSEVTVIVEEGEVYFYRSTGEGIYLKKGESAVYNRGNGSITKFDKLPMNATAYRDGILNFNNTPMSEVASAISKLYGVNVIADEKIANCKLTVRFENESLETVLSIISETLGLEVKHQDTTIVFSGNACN
ncbi:MAG TPA: FecR domain-containing protein [Bacteroidia bacterium]|nr:FecR domain-containing protein [Bacteroidia bacterium]HQK96911.1 FecR domain-containing protein [Bacteroidia bacterium]